MFCPFCGKELHNPRTFCDWCGKRIDSFVERPDANDETRVIGDDPAFDQGETRVIGGTGTTPTRTIPTPSVETDTSGLEVMAGPAAGYVPVDIPPTGVMPPVAGPDAAYAPNVQPYAPVTPPPTSVNAPKPKGKGKGAGRIVAIAILVLAIIAAVAGVAWYMHDKDVKEKAHATHAVVLTLDTPGLDANATGIPVVVEGTDLDGNKVSQVFYVNDKGEGIELMCGQYKLTFPASPMSPDGELWRAPTGTLTVSIPNTIQFDASFEGVKDQTVKFVLINAVDITDNDINTAYEYAKNDPNCGSNAATYRTNTAKVRDDAVAEAAAAAEAARQAAEEQARREAEEAARAAASPDGYYYFPFASQAVSVTQDEFGYWHITPKSKGEIRMADSLEGLSGSKGTKVSSLVFLLPESGVTYQSSGGTAGVQTLDPAQGYSTFLGMLKKGDGQGLAIFVRVLDGQATFVRISS